MRTRARALVLAASAALLCLAPLSPAQASDLPSPDEVTCRTSADGTRTCTTQTWLFLRSAGETFLPPFLDGGDPEAKCPHPRELPIYLMDEYQVTYHHTHYDANGSVIGTGTRTSLGDHYEFVRCERYQGQVQPHPGQRFNAYSPGQAWHQWMRYA